MDLSKITFFAFNEKHRQIYKLFDDPEKCGPMLDEARRELPIVDGLFGCLHELKALPEDERARAFNRIMQDVHLLLTLWTLVREAGVTKQTPDSASPQIAQNHLRLRKFGMN